jgi:hypothetical protein
MCRNRAVEPLWAAVENLWTDGRMPLADTQLTDETCESGAYLIASVDLWHRISRRLTECHRAWRVITASSSKL